MLLGNNLGSYHRIETLLHRTEPNTDNDTHECFITSLETWKKNSPLNEDRSVACQRMLYAKQHHSLSLDLSGLGITDLPEALGELVTLEKLFVNENPITDLPQSVVHLNKLRKIDISHTAITLFPAVLGKMENIRKILLFNTAICIENLDEHLHNKVFRPYDHLKKYESLNGKINHSYGDKIWCRHFASAITLAGDMKKTIAHFQTEKGIKTFFANKDVEGDGEKALEKTTNNYIVPNNEIGIVFYEQFHRLLEAMNTRKPQTLWSTLKEKIVALLKKLFHLHTNPVRKESAIAMLLSDDHAMSAELMIKKKNNEVYYVVKFFDTNARQTYQGKRHYLRFCTKNLEMIKKCTMQSFIGKKLEDYYFEDFPNERSVVVAIHNKNTIRNAHLVTKGEKVTPGTLYLLATTPHYRPDGVFEKIKTHLSTLGDIEKIAFLKAVNHKGNTALYEGFEYGNGPSIVGLSALIAESDLAEESQCDLFAATNKEGVPALHQVFLHDYEINGASLSGYIQIILNAHLSETNKEKLLRATGKEGEAGFFYAFENGSLLKIKNFCHTVLKSGLSIDTKVRLLSPTNREGQSGLYASLKNGQIGTALTFCHLIVNSDLPNAQKVRLIHAKNAEGTPWLYEALRNGDKASIISFCDFIAEAPLRTKDKIHLLAMRNQNGASGLHEAIKKLHGKTVWAVIKLTLSLHLSHGFERMISRVSQRLFRH